MTAALIRILENQLLIFELLVPEVDVTAEIVNPALVVCGAINETESLLQKLRESEGDVG